MADNRVFNLPNALTLARIAAVPVIAFLILLPWPETRFLAWLVFAIAAITDYFDGVLARKYDLQSPLGRMLDPIADKMLVGVTMLVLAFDNSFSSYDLIAATLILLREFFVSGLREYLGGKNVIVHVTRIAKYKTMVQLMALGLFILKPLWWPLGVLAIIMLWLAAILTIISGWNYWRGAVPHLFGDSE